MLILQKHMKISQAKTTLSKILDLPINLDVFIISQTGKNQKKINGIKCKKKENYG